MPFGDVEQPAKISITDSLRLRTVGKDDYSKAVPWYANEKVLYYSEGKNVSPYDIKVITDMYDYLKSIGELYFIEILEYAGWKAIGDATLSILNMPIVIGEETYWGRGIGSAVLGTLFYRAKKIGISSIRINIFEYNERSQRLYGKFGFVRISESGELWEWRPAFSDSHCLQDKGNVEERG